MVIFHNGDILQFLIDIVLVYFLSHQDVQGMWRNLEHRWFGIDFWELSQEGQVATFSHQQQSALSFFLAEEDSDGYFSLVFLFEFDE